MVSCFASPSPAPSKQLHFVLSPSLEVACLGVSSDSRRESTKRDTHVASDCIPLLFLFFFSFHVFASFPSFFFVLQPSVRMQSSWPFQAEEDNLVEEREGAVCGMFIESSARWRWRKEGRRGRRAESGKMWGVVQGSDIWSKGKTEGKRPRWGWWHLLHSNPDYVISFWRVLLLLTVSPPTHPYSPNTLLMPSCSHTTPHLLLLVCIPSPPWWQLSALTCVHIFCLPTSSFLLQFVFHPPCLIK